VKIALEDAGWKGISALVTHERGQTDRVFDDRDATRMKRYFQVVYDLTSCLKYSSRIPSQEPIKFYELLLKHVPTTPGQKSKDYAVLLNRLKGKLGQAQEALPIEDDVPPPTLALEYDDDEGMMLVGNQPAQPKAKAKSAASGSKRAAPTTGGQAEPTHRPTPPVAGPEAPPPVGAPEPPPSIVEPAPPPEPVEGPEDDTMFAPPPPVPAEPARKKQKRATLQRHNGLDGAEVSYDPYINPRTGVEYPNWILWCPRPGHEQCHKSRGTTIDCTRRHGDIEPLAYLHAWIPKDPPNAGDTHRSRGCNPSTAEVDAYVEAHRDELQRLVASICS